MCVCCTNWSSVVKLDLFWKQIISYMNDERLHECLFAYVFIDVTFHKMIGSLNYATVHKWLAYKMTNGEKMGW